MTAFFLRKGIISMSKIGSHNVIRHKPQALIGRGRKKEEENGLDDMMDDCDIRG